MNILVTGAAGFIGYHTSERLLRDGHKVVGLDNVNDYYDVGLKKARLERLMKYDRFSFVRMPIEDGEGIMNLFREHGFQRVIHLAAQAGVRYSLSHPQAYISSNLVGFTNILEACRYYETPHLIYASSSSVYGANSKMPFTENDPVDHPVSLYAATKKANELLAHTYSHLYSLPTTGLRFFTVYGPWGRPDMAYFSFARRITEGQPIQVYNYGQMKRDFTYIDDIVEGIARILDVIPEPNPTWNDQEPNPSSSYAPYRVYNIGNHQPVDLMEFISILESLLSRKAELQLLPMQSGDVVETYADTSKLRDAIGFKPATTLEEGLSRFVEWYVMYYAAKAEV